MEIHTIQTKLKIMKASKIPHILATWLLLLNATLLAGQIIADFNFSTDHESATVHVEFSNSSSEQDSPCQWELDGGKISTPKVPEANYNKPGKYGVKLFVFGTGNISDKIICLGLEPSFLYVQLYDVTQLFTVRKSNSIALA